MDEKIKKEIILDAIELCYEIKPEMTYYDLVLRNQWERNRKRGTHRDGAFISPGIQTEDGRKTTDIILAKAKIRELKI